MFNLFNLCPVKGSTGEFKLDHRGQSAVIALGIYYLESRLNFPSSPFPHKNKILPYFFDLMRNLPLARWTDSQLLFNNRCLPTSECFSFSLTTLLCDIAVLDQEARDEILDFQVTFLSEISQLILIKTQDPESFLSNAIISKRIVPLLFGHARAMGRFSNEPLFLKLFPKPAPPILVKTESPSSKNRSFNNFRSIIPQSLSTTVFANIESFHSKSKEDDSSYFRAFGSSFEVCNQSIQFSVAHLEAILKVAQSSLLDKPLLKYLDGLANEMFASQSGKYPYKSFSETLNLVLVTVLKQILSGHGQLPLTFMTDIQELVRSLFSSGQTELQSRHFDQHKHLLMESKATSNTLTSATRLDAFRHTTLN